MKAADYKQILLLVSTSKILFLEENSVDPYLAVQRIDEIRHLHLKYQNECKQFSIYPHLDLKAMDLYQKSIKEICEQYGIIVNFTGARTLEYKKGYHAYYYFKQQDITKLIVFNNKYNG